MESSAEVNDIADELNDSIFGHVMPEPDNTIDSTGFREYSFSSTMGEEPASLFTSTPQKAPAPRKASKATKVAGPRLPCPHCPKTLANQNTLAVHVKMHTMAIISKRMPKDQEMLNLTKSAIEKSLKEIQEEGQRNDLAERLCKFCTCVEECIATGEGENIIEFFSRYFRNILKDLDVLLPSALRSTVFLRTNQLLCDTEFVLELQKLLLDMGEADTKLLNAFVGHVSFKVFNWQFVMCLRILRGQSINDDAPVRQRFSSDVSHQEEFQQLVFHIGGSILHGVLKKSQLYPSNANWAEYGRVITQKFLQKSGSEPDDCLAHVKCFTKGRDRGGLKYLNPDSFNLFLVFFDTIQCLEGSDGSLPLEVVEDKLYSNDILMFMWDELVGTELTEEQSLHLFTDIVRCCTKVSAKGILKRRLNEYLTKAYSSVPLRPVLARS